MAVKEAHESSVLVDYVETVLSNASNSLNTSFTSKPFTSSHMRIKAAIAYDQLYNIPYRPFPENLYLLRYWGRRLLNLKNGKNS